MGPISLSTNFALPSTVLSIQQENPAQIDSLGASNENSLILLLHKLSELAICVFIRIQEISLHILYIIKERFAFKQKVKISYPQAALECPNSSIQAIAPHILGLSDSSIINIEHWKELFYHAVAEKNDNAAQEVLRNKEYIDDEMLVSICKAELHGSFHLAIEVSEKMKLQIRNSTIELGNAFLKETSLQDTLLHLVCRKGFINLMKQVLEHSPNFINDQNSEGETPLQIACCEGHEKIVEALLDNPNVNVNIKSYKGGVALHYACINKGTFKIAKMLLEKDPSSINAQDINNDTPLHLSCSSNKEKIVELFLHTKELNPGLQGKFGLLAIHWACEDGFLNIVRMLLEKVPGCINAQDEYGCTPLHFACESGHEQTVRLLLKQRNLEIEIKSKKGNTAIHYACTKGNPHIVKMILEISPTMLNAQNSRKETPLHICCENGTDDSVSVLLSHKGIDIGFKDNSGELPLHKACTSGAVKSVQMILEIDSGQINECSKRGETPLHYACFHGREEVVKALLGKPNINLRITNAQEITALHWACQQGFPNIVDMLLKQDCGLVNIQDNQGDSPLHLACSLGHGEVVKVLLKSQHLRTGIKNAEGALALHEACSRGNAKIIEMLLKRDPGSINTLTKNSNTPLIIAAFKGNEEAVKVLLSQEQINPMIAENAGFLAVHFASREGFSHIVELLLKAQPGSINAQTRLGYTPLYFACWAGKENVVRVLVSKNNLNVNLLSQNGNSALHAACEKGFFSIVKILLDKGSSLHVTDQFKDSPLHKAMKNGHGEVVREFIAQGCFNHVSRLKDFRLYQALCTQPVAKILLKHYPSIAKSLIQMEGAKSLDGHSLIQYLKSQIPLILQDAQENNLNPLEVALFMQSSRLASAVLRSMPRSKAYALIDSLCQVYPKAIDNILDLCMKDQPTHYLMGNLELMQLSPAPEGIDIEWFFTLFGRLNFTDPSNVNYIDPRRVQIGGTRLEISEFKERVGLFIKNLKEKSIKGMDSLTNSTRDDYYARLETALRHIYMYLDCHNNCTTTFNICLQFAAISGLCAAPYQHVTMSIYRSLCLEFSKAFDDELYDVVRSLREQVLHFMCAEPYVQHQQEAHALNYFRKALSKKLGLVNEYYDDVYIKNGFKEFNLPKEETVTISFYKYYTPSAIYQCIIEALSNPEFKSNYLKWAEKHCQDFLFEEDDWEIKTIRHEIKNLQDKYVEVDSQLIKSSCDSLRDQLLAKKHDLLAQLDNKKAALSERGIYPIYGIGISKSTEEELTERLRNKILSPLDGKPNIATLLRALERLYVLRIVDE